MTITKLAAGAAGALFVVLTGSVAFAAQSEGGYVCQTWRPAKASPPVTNCITWKRVAAARMHAAPCDPAKTAFESMQAQCEALMGAPERNARPPAAG